MSDLEKDQEVTFLDVGRLVVTPHPLLTLYPSEQLS